MLIWFNMLINLSVQACSCENFCNESSSRPGVEYCNGLTDLAKRVRPTPVVDATLAPSYSFEGVGGLAPQPFWPLAAGTG